MRGRKDGGGKETGRGRRMEKRVKGEEAEGK